MTTRVARNRKFRATTYSARELLVLIDLLCKQSSTKGN